MTAAATSEVDPHHCWNPAVPGHAVVANEAGERGARLDRAPAERVAVEVGDRPLVVPDSGCPQSVSERNRKANSSTPAEAQDSLGCIFYREHWHLARSPRVPNTISGSSQLASLAGTILTPGMAVFAMPAP